MEINWRRVLIPIYGILVLVFASMDFDYWLNFLLVAALAPTLLLLRKK
jgi:hypothetical protein